jgi:hypothetical protein
MERANRAYFMDLERILEDAQGEVTAARENLDAAAFDIVTEKTREANHRRLPATRARLKCALTAIERCEGNLRRYVAEKKFQESQYAAPNRNTAGKPLASAEKTGRDRVPAKRAGAK